jgi:hypothetical protein
MSSPLGFATYMYSAQGLPASRPAIQTHRPKVPPYGRVSSKLRRPIATHSTFKIKDYGSDVTSFTLDDEAHERLAAALSDAALCVQIAQQAGLPETASVRFTGMLFQPVPWSPSTPKGMPAEFEKFHTSPQHVVINVPPPIMFKSKVMRPPRLCAIYEATHPVPTKALELTTE